MIGFTKHVLVCTNERPAESPKGCCRARGADDVLRRFKDEIARAGLKDRMRANSSGCLDHCASGATVVVYPDAVWYGAVRPEDVGEIVTEHLVNGRPVERLRLAADAPR